MSWPVKTWTVGDPLPASELNTYVRDNLNQLDPSEADEGQLLAVNGDLDGYDFVTVDTEIVKAADETVNNSNTLQDDDDFAFAVEANSTYLVEAELLINSPSTPGWKFTWVLPTGATFGGSYMDNLSSEEWHSARDVASTTQDNVITAGAATAGTGQLWPAWFVIKTDATAGTAQFQWAQTSAQLQDTDILKGSRMRWRKVG